jgi:hypothetical protein
VTTPWNTSQSSSGAASNVPQLMATTGPSGTVLQNAVVNLLSWTAPNDGNMHRFTLITTLQVTVLEIGGTITWLSTMPNGQANNHQLYAGGLAAGSVIPVFASGLIAPGSTVMINQTVALTSGAGTLWAEIWGS